MKKTKKQKNKKNINSKGFTLIELLAVITILGILMIVAIPSVSRTIENSRRDTFADIALEYLDSVRESVLADELVCYTAADTGLAANNDSRTYASLPDGTYIFYLTTNSSYQPFASPVLPYQNTLDLMESGGKSSWGSNDVYGYVYWTKSTNGSTGNVTAKYEIILQDAAYHGISALTPEVDVKRSAVTSTIDSAYRLLDAAGKITIKTGVDYICGLA
jgi:type IV pilus assembly protein PilA